MPTVAAQPLQIAYLAIALTGLSVAVTAQEQTPLSAAESDPLVLGWMTGFPPPADKLIMQPESDFFSFPKPRWTVCNYRDLLVPMLPILGIGCSALAFSFRKAPATS